MKALQLQKQPHGCKQGERCLELEPNVFEDCVLQDGGEVVGFYIASIAKHSERLSKLVSIANAEFRSDRVPKTLLERADVIQQSTMGGKSRKQAKDEGTIQYSAIIGSVAANSLKRRYKHRPSRVHAENDAQNFVKAMLMASELACELIQDVMPASYQKLLTAIAKVPKELRFGRLWTSSISNYNIAAPYHTDRANLPESLNVIFTKRLGSVGGNLVVPDYGAVFEQPDDSMLVYPAWRNMHGVTPIKPLFGGGYRNSLVLYALNLVDKKNG